LEGILGCRTWEWIVTAEYCHDGRVDSLHVVFGVFLFSKESCGVVSCGIPCNGGTGID
jgi:hypothetical protein